MLPSYARTNGHFISGWVPHLGGPQTAINHLGFGKRRAIYLVYYYYTIVRVPQHTIPDRDQQLMEPQMCSMEQLGQVAKWTLAVQHEQCCQQLYYSKTMPITMLELGVPLLFC